MPLLAVEFPGRPKSKKQGEIMSLQKPVTGEFFVALFDLTNFGKFYKNNSSEKIFEAIHEFSSITTTAVEKAGGRIVRFSNDSGLAVFSAEEADKAVRCFLDLNTQIQKWCLHRNIPSKFAMNSHVGEGTMGTLSNGQTEIVGEVVGTVYSMGKKQFQLSAQVFRKLSPETRKAFRKFTPTIAYLPA
jgi:hypothetical protein